MMRRISNFLHRDHPPRAINAAADAAPQSPADRAPLRRERGRHRNAALRPADEHLPARAVSPQHHLSERLLLAVARLELEERRAQQPPAAEVDIEALVNNAIARRDARIAELRLAEPQAAAAVPNPFPVPALAPEPVPEPVEPAPALQAPEPFDLKLSDLRMHRDETDHNLVFAYPIPAGVYEPVALAVDAAGAELEGRAYLEFLKSDPRTGVAMKVLLKSKIFANRRAFTRRANQRNRFAVASGIG